MAKSSVPCHAISADCILTADNASPLHNGVGVPRAGSTKKLDSGKKTHEANMKQKPHHRVASLLELSPIPH
jgi:hypothetical protein